MDFLSPWYLLGAAAIVAPILLHLRRRPPKEFVPFSSLMFLEKTPERLTRRSKLERLWLLLLRCAVLIILALLFARPFFNSDKAGANAGEGRRLVVLLDRSASMQREGLWKKALEQVDEVLDETSPRDEVTFATFADELTVLSGFAESRAGSPAVQTKAVRAQLAELEPGWGGSELGSALIAAADLIEGAENEQGSRRSKEIVVISDFQEGAERESLNRYAWPESVRVRCVLVEPEDFANLTLNLVATARAEEDESDVGADGAGDSTAASVGDDDDDGEDDAQGSQRRVRIRNARADGREASFSLRWEDSTTGAAAEAVVKGNVPPGGSRVVSAPPRDNEANDGVLLLEGDRHEFDNRAFVARVQPRPIRVLYLAEKPDPQDTNSALFYLLRAMQPTAVLTPEVEAVAFADLSGDDLNTAHVLVVASTPPENLAPRLGAAVESGTALFWILREDDDSEAAAAALASASGVGGWSISEAKRGASGSYAMLADLDFEAAVLAPFARAKVRDFTGIHIWKHRELVIPKVLIDNADGSEEKDGESAGSLRVLARYDSGAPAWLQLQRGAGRMYFFTAGWEPAESQLALSSKFVPLLYAMLGEAGFSALAPQPLVVGQALPAPVGAERASVKLPDGSSVDSKVNEGVFQRTELPGLYTVTHAGGESVYGVNLAADESRIDAFDPLLLADFSLPVEVAAGASAGDTASARRTEAAREEAALEQRRLEETEKEGRQKLWKWLVLVVLGVLLLESWVAGRPPKAGVETPSEQAA